MMEYIGATAVPVTFYDVPVEQGIDFTSYLALPLMQTPPAIHKMANFHPIGNKP